MLPYIEQDRVQFLEYEYAAQTPTKPRRWSRPSFLQATRPYPRTDKPGVIVGRPATRPTGMCFAVAGARTGRPPASQGSRAASQTEPQTRSSSRNAMRSAAKWPKTAPMGTYTSNTFGAKTAKAAVPWAITIITEAAVLCCPSFFVYYAPEIAAADSPAHAVRFTNYPWAFATVPQNQPPIKPSNGRQCDPKPFPRLLRRRNAGGHGGRQRPHDRSRRHPGHVRSGN